MALKDIDKNFPGLPRHVTCEVTGGQCPPNCERRRASIQAMQSPRAGRIGKVFGQFKTLPSDKVGEAMAARITWYASEANKQGQQLSCDNLAPKD